jgi:hypothetical protein
VERIRPAAQIPKEELIAVFQISPGHRIGADKAGNVFFPRLSGWLSKNRDLDPVSEKRADEQDGRFGVRQSSAALWKEAEPRDCPSAAGSSKPATSM